MKSLALEDTKLRIFIDTNILIDCFVTPELDVKTFVEDASKNSLIELVTSDYALWEQNEFIRKQTWIKYLINKGRSHNEALTYRLNLDPDLRKDVSNNISKAKLLRDGLNIFNYNLMDEEIPNKDFFSRLELLTINSTISNQDLLILLSAYVTKSGAILTKDGAFNSSVLDVAGIEEALGSSLLPKELKKLKFISDLTKHPQQHYNIWFENKFIDFQIAKVTCFYNRIGVICVDCIEGEEIKIGDYLLLSKVISNTEFKRIVFQVAEGNLNDYDSNSPIKNGKKVTIKLPEEYAADRWMVGAKIFRIEPN